MEEIGKLGGVLRERCEKVKFHMVAVAQPGKFIQIGKNGIRKLKTRSNSRRKRGNRFEMGRRMES